MATEFQTGYDHGPGDATVEFQTSLCLCPRGVEEDSKSGSNNLTDGQKTAETFQSGTLIVITSIAVV